MLSTSINAAVIAIIAYKFGRVMFKNYIRSYKASSNSLKNIIAPPIGERYR